jgi:hypothetical protein
VILPRKNTSSSCLASQALPLQAGTLLEKLLKALATTVLSLALLLTSATPSLADQPASATTPAFLPSPGDLFGGSDGKLLSKDESEEQLSPEEQATVSIFERNTPSVVNISNLGSSYASGCVFFFSRASP